MISRDIDSHIHFIHAADEVAALTAAVIPMAEYVAVVARSDERSKLKLITSCQYFRVRDAERVCGMLKRACKYARAHLGDYFPGMQQGIVGNIETLENATDYYWSLFEQLREETIPVH